MNKNSKYKKGDLIEIISLHEYKKLVKLGNKPQTLLGDMESKLGTFQVINHVDDMSINAEFLYFLRNGHNWIWSERMFKSPLKFKLRMLDESNS